MQRHLQLRETQAPLLNPRLVRLHANSTVTGTTSHVDENSNAARADQQEQNPNDPKPASQENNQDAWQTQRRRKRRQRDHGDTTLSGRGAAGRLADSKPSRLYGSARVSSKPLHLSHLGPECNVADVILYCREKRVIVTGCYFIRTRICQCGTQSAKCRCFIRSRPEWRLLAKPRRVSSVDSNASNSPSQAVRMGK